MLFGERFDPKSHSIMSVCVTELKKPVKLIPLAEALSFRLYKRGAFELAPLIARLSITLAGPELK